jgi:hypothetical protein
VAVSARSHLVASRSPAVRVSVDNRLGPGALVVALARRYPWLVTSGFEGEVEGGDDLAVRLDVDACARDRVGFLLVDAFDVGEIANDRVAGRDGAVGTVGLSLKQLDAAEVGVLNLGTEGPDQCRCGADSRRANGSGLPRGPSSAWCW